MTHGCREATGHCSRLARSSCHQSQGVTSPPLERRAPKPPRCWPRMDKARRARGPRAWKARSRGGARAVGAWGSPGVCLSLRERRGLSDQLGNKRDPGRKPGGRAEIKSSHKRHVGCLTPRTRCSIRGSEVKSETRNKPPPPLALLTGK